LDIERTGIVSIDSFDAKSYECRIEFLGVRFDVESDGVCSVRPPNRTARISFGIESNGAKHSIDSIEQISAMCGKFWSWFSVTD
jgi:hypothetical protein